MIALLFQAAMSTLPADNGGVTTYGKGSLYSGGSVVCTNFSASDYHANYSFRIGPEVDGAA